jgi:hypothetical protein
MTQRAINMHLSQVAHGMIFGADYKNNAYNWVALGYVPSMIHLHLYNGANPIAQVYWYSHDPDVIMIYENGQVPVETDTIFDFTYTSFGIHGGKINAELVGVATGLRWQVDGCHYDDSYRVNMNPDAVDGGDAMDFIRPGGPHVAFPGNGEGEEEVGEEEVAEEEVAEEEVGEE